MEALLFVAFMRVVLPTTHLKQQGALLAMFLSHLGSHTFFLFCCEGLLYEVEWPGNPGRKRDRLLISICRAFLFVAAVCPGTCLLLYVYPQVVQNAERLPWLPPQDQEDTQDAIPRRYCPGEPTGGGKLQHCPTTSYSSESKASNPGSRAGSLFATVLSLLSVVVFVVTSSALGCCGPDVRDGVIVANSRIASRRLSVRSVSSRLPIHAPALRPFLRGVQRDREVQVQEPAGQSQAQSGSRQDPG